MATIATMGCLSEDGWCIDSLKVADMLLSYFFVSEHSQSYLYYGLISSLPYIIQNNNGNMDSTIMDTQNTLYNLFNRFFTSVTVVVNSVPNVAEPSMGQIAIFMEFTDTDGVVFNLNKLLQMQNLKITKIISVNNTGG